MSGETQLVMYIWLGAEESGHGANCKFDVYVMRRSLIFAGMASEPHPSIIQSSTQANLDQDPEVKSVNNAYEPLRFETCGEGTNFFSYEHTRNS